MSLPPVIKMLYIQLKSRSPDINNRCSEKIRDIQQLINRS